MVATAVGPRGFEHASHRIKVSSLLQLFHKYFVLFTQWIRVFMNETIN